MIKIQAPNSTENPNPVRNSACKTPTRRGSPRRPWDLNVGASLNPGRWGLSFWTSLVLAFTVLVLSSPAAETSTAPSVPWSHSVVTLEISRKQYDFYQPWTKRTHRL